MMQQVEPEAPEMTSMFASVWVKVEVADSEEEDASKAPKEEQFPVPPMTAVDLPPINLPTRAKKKRNPPRKILYCDLCNYSSPYKNCITAHIIGHHTTTKPFQCQFCAYRTKYSSSLNRHLAMRHWQQEVMNGKHIESFPCDSCDYVSYCKWNLKAHKRKHIVEKKYKCEFPECTFATAYRNVYTKHLKKHVNMLSLYKCDKCDYETKFMGHIQRHKAQIHDQHIAAPNVCDLCGFSNDQQWKLKMHLLRSKRTKEMSCFCGWKSFYRCAYRKHKVDHLKNEMADDTDQNQIDNVVSGEKLVQNESFRCDLCTGYIATTKGQLQRHNLEVHYQMDTLLYKCHSCPYSTPDRWRYNNHLQSNTPENTESLISCALCGYQTSLQCGMKHHRSTVHMNEIDDIVPSDLMVNKDVSKDGTVFEEISARYAHRSDLSVTPNYTKEELKAIQQTEHEKSNNYVYDQKATTIDFQTIPVLETQGASRPFECTLCKYTSKFKATVQRHYQRHHTDQKTKPYKCVNCDFSTKTKDQITLHNKRSQTNSVILCKECSYKTYFKCALVLHQKVHYMYRCNKCEYACRLKYDLAKHLAAFHLGTGLKCRYCSFTAVRKDTMVNHENMHTGNKRFKCGFCEYSAVRKSMLDNHLKKNHTMEKQIAQIVTESMKMNFPLPEQKGEIQQTTAYEQEKQIAQIVTESMKMNFPLPEQKGEIQQTTAYEQEKQIAQIVTESMKMNFPLPEQKGEIQQTTAYEQESELGDNSKVITT